MKLSPPPPRLKGLSGPNTLAHLPGASATKKWMKDWHLIGGNEADDETGAVLQVPVLPDDRNCAGNKDRFPVVPIVEPAPDLVGPLRLRRSDDPDVRPRSPAVVVSGVDVELVRRPGHRLPDGVVAEVSPQAEVEVEERIGVVKAAEVGFINILRM